jgi:hypothetical protein
MQVPQKIKVGLSIPLLGTYLKESKSAYSRDTCTPMFIVAQLATTKSYDSSKCPSKGEWIKKMWYISSNDKELGVDLCLSKSEYRLISFQGILTSLAFCLSG